MAKLRDIRFLAQETAKDVSGSQETGWGIWIPPAGCTATRFPTRS